MDKKTEEQFEKLRPIFTETSIKLKKNQTKK